MVEDALSNNERVWQLISISGPLVAHASIGISGIVDGETVTALMKRNPVPMTLHIKTGAAELQADSSVVTRGQNQCQPCSKVRKQLVSDVQFIYATDVTFAALKYDGSAVVWGEGS